MNGAERPADRPAARRSGCDQGHHRHRRLSDRVRLACLAGRRPHNDATVLPQLRAAGAVIIGKTVTTEFAYFQPRQDPQPARSRTHSGRLVVGFGGGSGGARWCRSLSARRPTARSSGRRLLRRFRDEASHGLVSRAGVLPLSRTLDHIGPFARSIEDIALVLDAIAGFDPDDPDTRPLAASIFANREGRFRSSPRLAFVKHADVGQGGCGHP